MEQVKWCSFCQSAPADGELFVEDPDGNRLWMPSCETCANGPGDYALSYDEDVPLL